MITPRAMPNNPPSSLSVNFNPENAINFARKLVSKTPNTITEIKIIVNAVMILKVLFSIIGSRNSDSSSQNNLASKSADIQVSNEKASLKKPRQIPRILDRAVTINIEVSIPPMLRKLSLLTTAQFQIELCRQQDEIRLPVRLYIHPLNCDPAKDQRKRWLRLLEQ